MKQFIFLLSFIFICLNCSAQMPGSNDPSFNPVDSGYGYEADDAIFSTAIQNDGKIILAGFFSRYNGVLRNKITRCNTDGTLDTTFHIGTGVNDAIYSTAIQTDGKILIAGSFTTCSGAAKKRIARLNTDGTLDPSFNTGLGANMPIRAVALQTDGKIIVGGEFTTYNGVAKNYIVRLNTDGTLDATFNGTGTDYHVYSVSIQTDGKIIIGGQFGNYSGTAINCLARLNTDGTLDATFNIGTGPSNVRAIAIQADGKIIIGGGFAFYNGTSRGHIARVNVNGALDLTFANGSGFNGDVYSIKIQADGKILAGGAFTNFATTTVINLCRININGSIDATTFNSGTYGPQGTVFGIIIQTDGKIIVAGSFATYNGLSKNNLVRINTNGTLDGTLNGGTGANSAIFATALQSDGKIIIGGSFYSYNGVLINRIARLNADGSLDASFNVGSGANDKVLTTAVQADGKVIIGGYFTTYNGYPRSRIVRINTDGSIDLTFNMGAGANGIVYSIAIQTDGKIIIVGNFTSYKGSAKNYIARLNSDGTVDGSFISTGTDNTILTTAIQADGKIVIGGQFGTYNGTAKNNVARINTNGSIDATFTGLGAGHHVRSIAFQSNNKIIIVGDFTNYNGTTINRIARINTDGTLDATFNVGTGLNSYVRSVAVQQNDKVIVAGDFNSYNNSPSSSVIRLDTNGTLDPIFVGVSYTFPLPTYATAIQTDDKIIIAGNFTSYSGVGRNCISRLFGGNCIPATCSFTSVNPNCYASSSGSINTSVSGGTAPYTYSWSPSGEVTQNITNKAAGSYTLRVTDNLGCSTATSTTLSNPASIISSVTANQILCNGSNVTLSVTPTSTLATLTYTWMSSGNTLNNTNSATVLATPSVTEIYTVSVSNGTCIETKTISVIVNAQPTFTLSVLSGTTTCAHTGVGFNVNTPYSVVWSGPGVINPATTVATVTITGAGIYTVTISDGTCVNTVTVPVMTNTTAPVVSINAMTPVFCDGGSAILSASSTPSTSVTYLWDNAATTQSISVSPTVTTVYTATVTDNVNGCYTSNSTTVTVYPLPTLTVTGTNTICLGTSVGLTSTGGMTYTWNTGATTSSITVNPASTTIYTVMGTDMYGCINSQTVSVTVNNTCADVWPGDANSDGLTDNLDVLELGLHYTQTGAPRASISNAWQSYFANNWTGTITNGKNLNHSDCNGDGTIDANDTLAIYNNYGLTHALKPAQTTTVNPQLSIVPDQLIVVKGMWGTASVYLGDATSPINSINGIAYTIDFDNTLIEPSNVWIEYQNSFMDAGQNLHFQKPDFVNGKIYSATTHTISNNVNGFGKIATLHYQISSSLVTDQALTLGLSQVNQSDASGIISPLTSGTGTLMAIGASVGLKENVISENVSISPNPTNGLLMIHSTNDMQHVEICNIAGQVLLQQVCSDKSHQLQLQNFAEGVYFVKVVFVNGASVVKKIVKQ